MISFESLLRASLAVVTCFVTVNASNSDTAGYILQVIQYLTGTETGSTNCVFYGPANGDILEKVLPSAELSSVTKFILTNETNPASIAKEDIADHLLIIIETQGVFQSYLKLHAVLKAFDPKTRVLLLGDTLSMDCKLSVQVLMKHWYYNVVVMDEGRHQMLAVDFLNSVPLKYRAHPKELFNRKLLHGMQGRPLAYTSRTRLHHTIPKLKWIQETARFMNTTAVEIKHKCSAKNILLDKCYINHVKKSNIDVDMSEYSLKNVARALFRVLVLGVSDEDVILLPRFQLTIVELFTIPFEWQVWFLLAVIFALIEALKLIFPQLIRKDPILLVVCGLERYDLHRAKRWEKMILLPVMVLIFFTTAAYEIKLLSFMVSKPLVQPISTIQELATSGIMVKVNLLGRARFQNNTSLKGLLIHSNDSYAKMDTIHAYILKRKLAEIVLPLYYNPDERYYHYTILDQTLGINTRMTVLGPRSPFRITLGFTHEALIESGLMTYWELKMEQLFSKMVVGDAVEIGEVLYLADLAPAWIALGSGVVVSLIFFIMEIGGFGKRNRY